MDIVRFKGGLGNQMFQYALVEALRNRGRQVKSSLGFYRNHPDLAPFVLNKIFKTVSLEEIDDATFNQIDGKWKELKKNFQELEAIVNNPTSRFFWVEENAFTYYEDIFRTMNCVFVGYWQSERYFKSIQDVIIKKFQFPVEEIALYKLGEKLKRNNYISLHVRRGDYLKYNQGVNVCPLSYYNNSIDYMKKIIPNAKFIFFSDDIKWVKEAFLLDDMIICNRSLFECYEDWYDMYLMTQCRGNIISNSTFSWWGAWLNQNQDKIVIAPKRWHYEKETRDIWCENWIRI